MADRNDNPLNSPDRWYRLFDTESNPHVRIDVPPVRDEHVQTLAARLHDIAGKARGRLCLDLTVVEEYSWTWIKALLDLSSYCSDLGGALCLEGMNPEGAGKFKANKTLRTPRFGGVRQPQRASSELLPISGQQAAYGRTGFAARRGFPAAA
ncbi:MAG: hypothetical protein JSR77_14585 [Planctomycetes bacterium]|nr:hypothetical protein [Planctomycetota bacterium]